MRKRFKDKKQFRLKGWDYRWQGYYFITINTLGRERYFGEVVKERMEYSEIGMLAKWFLLEIPWHFPGIKIYSWVVMPDHVHFILDINISIVGTRNLRVPIKNNKHRKFGPLQSGGVGIIVNQYKRAVKLYCNKNGFKDFEWQPRYYDRVVRNQKELNKIEMYILDNPKNWKNN